jgi:hypothetical protein
LNTILQLKDYNDFMIDDIDACLKTLFIDWADSKSNASGGLGKFGELKLSLLNDELGTTAKRKEELEAENVELKEDLEKAKAKIRDMIPDNRRAKELSDKNIVLKQSLQETLAKLTDLEVTHRGLTEMKNQLEVSISSPLSLSCLFLDRFFSVSLCLSLSCVSLSLSLSPFLLLLSLSLSPVAVIEANSHTNSNPRKFSQRKQ